MIRQPVLRVYKATDYGTKTKRTDLVIYFCLLDPALTDRRHTEEKNFIFNSKSYKDILTELFLTKSIITVKCNRSTAASEPC